MENEHNERVRKVARQSWKPPRSLQILHGIWNAVYSFIKIGLAAVATVLLILVVCMLAFVGILADYLENDILPNSEVVMDDFDQSGNSVMYYVDANGEIQVLQRLHANTNKDWATYDEIPEALVYAAVAIEDHRFFEHQGVDWIPTIKACVNMFVGGSKEFGGSSITQQLIKNLYLEYDETADDVTVQRKVLEIFRATEFEKRYDKEFIMEWYLNKIYLGERCKGVKTAAATYFGKELEDLNAAECAALISITNNPSLFNPYRTGLDNYKGEQLNGMERNKRRREDTLYMMKEYGWLTEDEYAVALEDSANITLKRGVDEADRYSDCINEACKYHGKNSTFIKKNDGKTYCPQCGQSTTVGSDASQVVYSWFVDAVWEEVAQVLCERAGVDWATAKQETRDDFKRMVSQGGYHIYTTLDMSVQNQVDKIYTDLKNIPNTNSMQQLQSGIVVIDNITGDIVAMAGGVGEKNVHDAYSKATDAKLQPGSSMKPLTVYAPGFELGVINPGSVLEDLPFYYVNEQPFPRNSDRQYTYSTTAWKAVVSSVNAAAVNALDIMGREYGFNFAKDKFGLSTLVKSYTNSNGQVFSDVEWAPLALGAPTVGVTVRDMSTAYATFANNGVYRDSRTYSHVYDNDGKLIIDNKQVSNKIISDKTTEYMNYCLQGVVDYGTGTLASFNNYNVEVYGKTGSTTSNKDRWFCGFTSRYTAAVWCGYEHPEAISGVSPSGNPAVRLWKMVMEPLHKGYTDKPLVNMENFVAVNICMDCGKRATTACELDFRTQNYKISRVESVSVYPEDAPTEVCDCHIVVDFCTASNSVAHTGCTSTVKRSLVKKTKTQVNALADASKVGLWSSHSSDGYIWLVDKNGADQPFYGVHGDKNVGITAPYIQCQVHKPAPVVPSVPSTEEPTEP